MPHEVFCLLYMVIFPSPPTMRTIALILASLLCSPLTVHASAAADDGAAVIATYVRTFRGVQEPFELTSKHKATIPSFFADIAFPVTWNFQPSQQPLPHILSKHMGEYIRKKSLYPPSLTPDGRIVPRVSLSDHVDSMVFAPLLWNRSIPERSNVVFTPVFSDLADTTTLRTAQIMFCQFGTEAALTRSTMLPVYPSLDAVAKAMEKDVKVSPLDFGGDAFVPSIMSQAITDTTFFGLPAKQLDMVFEWQAKLRTYRGIYAIADKSVVCAEIDTHSSDWESALPIFKKMLAATKIRTSSVHDTSTAPSTRKLSPSSHRKEIRLKGRGVPRAPR